MEESDSRSHRETVVVTIPASRFILPSSPAKPFPAAVITNGARDVKPVKVSEYCRSPVNSSTSPLNGSVTAILPSERQAIPLGLRNSPGASPAPPNTPRNSPCGE